jgi:type I restriction enzyme, S subunit
MDRWHYQKGQWGHNGVKRAIAGFGGTLMSQTAQASLFPAKRPLAQEPWKLPSGWEWVPLGSVCLINPRRPRLECADDAPTSFLPMAGVDELDGTIVSLEERPFKEVARGFTYFEEGDVLFAKITPCMQNGKCVVARGLCDQIGFGSTEFHVLRPGPRLTADWVHRFLRRLAFRLEAKEHFRGAVGQQRVPEDFLASSLIPVPPNLDIQRRIVARIETLLTEVKEARVLATAIRHDTDRIMDATLAEVFESCHSTEQTYIAEVCRIRGGIQKTPHRAPKTNAHPYLRVANVQRGYLALDDIAYFEVTDNELERYRLVPGDVLIIEGNGSLDHIGRTAVFRGEVENCVHQNHVICLRPLPSEIMSDFLHLYLTSPSGREEITRRSHTSSGLLNLSVGKIKEIQIPRLLLQRQKSIVEYVSIAQEEVSEMRRLQAQDAELLDQLEQSILEHAFRGEL